jgi:cysteine desulfurase
MPERIYLDHNATSPPRPESIGAVRDLLLGPPGNPSSLHAEGRAARAHLEDARERVAALAEVAPREVVFTGGGSEAITAAVRGVCDRAPRNRRRILVSAVEHSAVLDAAKAAANQGFRVERVPCDQTGRVSVESFRRRLGPDVCLAALQWANNETGVIQPVAEVGPVCRKARVPLLVDAVQAAGKIPLDPYASEIDLMTLSAHKLGGPQGVGALTVREGIVLAPLVAGGAQERRRRGGTEAVAAIAGFGAAAERAKADLGGEPGRLLLLRARIESRLRDRYPEVRLHGEGSQRLPNTVNFALPGVPGEMLVIAMDVAGFALSTGSACSSGSVKPSHVIKAMGYGDAQAREAVRVSLGWNSTQEDVDRFLEALPGCVNQIRDKSVVADRGL